MNIEIVMLGCVYNDLIFFLVVIDFFSENDPDIIQIISLRSMNTTNFINGTWAENPFRITHVPDKADADFTRMYEKDRTSGNVWIDDIHQKTVFKVTQWGTEATSATAVVYQAPVDDAPEDYDNGAIIFNANHPFLFFVVERGSGAILFEGVFTGGNGND